PVARLTATDLVLRGLAELRPQAIGIVLEVEVQCVKRHAPLPTRAGLEKHNQITGHVGILRFVGEVHLYQTEQELAPGDHEWPCLRAALRRGHRRVVPTRRWYEAGNISMPACLASLACGVASRLGLTKALK